MPRPVLPKGFKVSGIHAGIKRFNKDLGLIFSESPCKSVGMFTKNKIKAAPVIVTRENLAKGEGIKAVIINSGNANCATGRQGMTDAKKMVSVTAQELGVKFANVCVASTGVIGRTLPIDKISAAIPVAVKRLSDSALMSLAKAILTTDKNRKVETAHISVGGKQVTITGLCKGAGMVHPNMATMLCFIMTDADIDKDALKTALKECVQDTFNVITVDGDMSTNDSVILMANGMSGNTVVKKGTRDYKTFRDALRHVTMELAKEIVKDGEGATKFVEIKVTGARTEKDAQKVARTIANSCLVKTSIHGQDPNWGRIASSVGSTMIEYIRPNKVEIHLDGVCMFRNNQFTNPPAGRVSGIYKKANVDILVNLNSGSKSAKMYTCDLSKRYVEINAHYLT